MTKRDAVRCLICKIQTQRVRTESGSYAPCRCGGALVKTISREDQRAEKARAELQQYQTGTR